MTREHVDTYKTAGQEQDACVVKHDRRNGKTVRAPNVAAQLMSAGIRLEQR